MAYSVGLCHVFPFNPDEPPDSSSQTDKAVLSDVTVDKNVDLGDSYFRLTDSRDVQGGLQDPSQVSRWDCCGPSLSSSEPQGALQWKQVTGVCRGAVLLLKSTWQTLGHVLGHVLTGECPAAEPSTHSERGVLSQSVWTVWTVWIK